MDKLVLAYTSSTCEYILLEEHHFINIHMLCYMLLYQSLHIMPFTKYTPFNAPIP